MEKDEIIKAFLEHDILLTPEEFEMITPENFSDILSEKKLRLKSEVTQKENLNTENESVKVSSGISEEELKEIPEESEAKQEKKEKPKKFPFSSIQKTLGFILPKHNESQKEKKPDIFVKRIYGTEKICKKMLTVMDIAAIYIAKYNALREIIAPRMNPLSINKITGSKDKTDIIGIVSCKTENGFSIEDETGVINIAGISSEGIENDDVIGVSGRIKGGMLFPENIIFPDIPLDNMHKTIGCRISFDFSSSMQISYNSHKILMESNAEMLLISENNEKMKALIFRCEESVNIDYAISLLKKRCMKTAEFLIPCFFIIQEVPDIFIIASNGGKAERANYKGVSIFIAGQKAEIEIEG